MDRISAWLPRRRGRIPSLARLNARRIAWLIAGVLLVLWGVEGRASYQECAVGQFTTWTTEGTQRNGARSGFYSPWCTPPHGNGPVSDLKDCYSESWVTVSGSESGTFWHQDRVEKNGIVVGGHESANHTSRRVVTVPLSRKSCTRPSTAFEFSCSTNPNGSFTDNWNWTCGTPQPTPTPAPTEECPPAGTAVPGIVGGLCIGGACDKSGMCAEITDTGALGQYNGNFCAADRVKSVSAGDAVSGQYVFTGDTCDADGRQLPENNQQQEGVPEGCARNDSTGVTVCLTDTDDDCGTVNGDAFCAKDVPTNGCKNTSQGGRLCDKNAPTPPKPNKGTPGDEADEDAEVTGEGGNQYYYYNAVTVGNSNGGDNDGDGDGEENCTDEQGNPIPCGQPSDCDEQTGDCTGAVRGPGFSAKTFGQSLAQFSEDVQGSGVGQLFGSAAAAMPAGSCPALNLDLFFGNVSTNAHCELASELAVLSSVFIAIYVFLGIRIIGSA